MLTDARGAGECLILRVRVSQYLELLEWLISDLTELALAAEREVESSREIAWMFRSRFDNVIWKYGISARILQVQPDKGIPGEVSRQLNAFLTLLRAELGRVTPLSFFMLMRNSPDAKTIRDYWRSRIRAASAEGLAVVQRLAASLSDLKTVHGRKVDVYNKMRSIMADIEKVF